MAAVATGLLAQDPPDRNEKWLSDLDELGRVISERHKNPFFKTPREQFFRAVDDVRKRIPTLKDPQIVVEFMKLAALIGDGHTVAYPGSDSAIKLRRFPIALMWFKDGLHVVASGADQKDLLRARVVAIGGVPVDKAAERVAVMGASDNASGARHASANWLTIPEALAGVGIVDDPEKCTFKIVDREGRERSVDLAPVADPYRKSFGFDKPNHELPISRRLARSRYGQELLPESKALYAWYDACSDTKEKPVAAWCEELLKEIDDKKPARIVIDVRRNGGGNSSLLNPLLTGLRKRPDAVAPGRLFVLVDRATYSSAIINAVDLKKAFKAVLVGLPPGGALNGYGEIRTLALPHSKWVVQYSTKYFKLGPDGIDALAPDVEVEPTAAEFFSGSDPVLNAAVSYKPKND
ncbi:MAG TPA: hypothetical protein VJU16_02055 [Planctomycetota bacterium]|nr:hypothetical protein [Planctomycetota bacterium]